MAKRPKKKKSTQKKTGLGVQYTPFSMLDRVNDIANLDGKANRTPFELQLHGLMLGFDFLHQLRENIVDKTSSSRIGLQSYLGQYVGVAGHICDVRKNKEGVSLLIVNPTLVGTFGERPRTEVYDLIKNSNGGEILEFQNNPNQPVFSSHVWMFLPEVDASCYRDDALYLGSVVTFYAKVELYGGKVATSHLNRAPKYGLGDFILNQSYIPYMPLKSNESSLSTSRSGIQVQTLHGNVRRSSVSKFNKDFALVLIEGAKVVEQVNGFLKVRKLSRSAHWNWVYNFMLDYDPEVNKGITTYKNFKAFIVRNGQKLSADLEVLTYRKVCRDKLKSQGLLGVYDLISSDLDIFSDYTDCEDFLVNTLGFEKTEL